MIRESRGVLGDTTEKVKQYRVKIGEREKRYIYVR